MTKIDICIDIDEILVGIVKCKIAQIKNRVMKKFITELWAYDPWLKSEFCFRINGRNLTKFCMKHCDIDKI